MKLSYRILDCDIFESYMALEGWDSFPFLKTICDENGSMGIFLKNASYMVFDNEHTSGLLKAICIYQVFGDTLFIKYFEVNKNYRNLGIGEAAIERLMLETGTKKIELDAKDENAANFWSKIGLEKSDFQHFYMN